MECLNKVHLRGRVGNARLQEFNDSRLCRFSVATNYAYKDRGGAEVIETTWHNCLAWEGPMRQGIDGIVKGAMVELMGRIRHNKYTDSAGIERMSTEILVDEFVIFNNEEVK